MSNIPLNDKFYRNNESEGPAERFKAIAPSDGNDLSFITTGIYVGVTGDVSVLAIDDTTPVVFKNAQQGSIIPIRARRVRNTGTTAQSLVALG